MKVIFFGLGSIGRKHYHNLVTICKDKNIDLEVFAYRSKMNNEKTLSSIKMIYDKKEIEDDYDIAFITNPTSFHLETLQMIKNKSRYYFVEKPVFEVPYAIEEFIENKESYYIAAPLRYKSIMTTLRNYIEGKKIYNARVICSSYLPDWRKDDYRISYSAKPNLGGGIELDCIHELDYIINLFGFPDETKAMFGKKSHLEINSNDSAAYLLNYNDKIIEVHLDYYGQVSQRKIEVITDNDLIVCDFIENSLISSRTGGRIQVEEGPNQMYLNELTYFIDYVMTGKENNNNIVHANEVLKIAKETN